MTTVPSLGTKVLLEAETSLYPQVLDIPDQAAADDLQMPCRDQVPG